MHDTSNSSLPIADTAFADQTIFVLEGAYGWAADVLTAEEAAKYLRVSVKTLCRLVSAEDS